MKRRSPPLHWVVLLLGLLPAMVHAQAAPPPPAPITALPPPEAPKGTFVSSEKISKLADKPQGWSYGVKLGANANVAANKDVVGQVEGRSVLLGFSILSNVGYLHNAHEWLNTGSLTEMWARTPTINKWAKSNDLLDLQSIYNYFINDYTGPFARLQLQTGILPTRRITENATDYQNMDDATGPVQRSRKFKLSNSFQPFTINESLGWFVQPIHSDRLNVVGRAGFGGRHTFADGARAIKDATAAPVTYTLLKDVHQAGVELFGGIDGKEVEGRLIYSLGAVALFPMLNNDHTSRNIAKLTRVQLQAAVGVAIFTWMSLNYQLKVIRDVQLIDAIQVQNAMLLSFQYGVSSDKPKPAPVPPAAEAKIAELEARAEAAEDRATKAEARAREAETPPPPAAEPPAPPAAPPATR